MNQLPKINREKIHNSWIQAVFVKDAEAVFPFRTHEKKEICSPLKYIDEILAESIILKGPEGGKGIQHWYTDFQEAHLAAMVDSPKPLDENNTLKDVCRLQIELCFIIQGYQVISATTFAGEGDFYQQKKSSEKMIRLLNKLYRTTNNTFCSVKTTILACEGSKDNEAGYKQLKQIHREAFKNLLADKSFSFLVEDDQLNLGLPVADNTEDDPDTENKEG